MKKLTKFLFVLTIILLFLPFVIILVFGCCSFNEKTKEFIELSLKLLSAFGPFAAVVYTLYTSLHNKYAEVPVLEMEIGNDSPFCLQNEQVELDKAENNNAVDMCGYITNKETTVAKNCQVICEKIYTYNEDGKSVQLLKEMRPIYFPWLDNQNIEDGISISQNIKRFFKYAEISFPSEEIKEDSISNPPKQASIVIFQQNKEGSNPDYRILPQYKHILLHVQICSSECNIQTYGISIVWKGTKINDYKKPAMLEVEKIPESEVKKLIKLNK